MAVTRSAAADRDDEADAPGFSPARRDALAAALARSLEFQSRAHSLGTHRRALNESPLVSIGPKAAPGFERMTHMPREAVESLRISLSDPSLQESLKRPSTNAALIKALGESNQRNNRLAYT